ncbi:uncharacterized protein BXZ73DRAFT_81248 [Epithele typhae]|uniref:uncharacterized protein n=1 Tax=Epithele typhae TaxID=378194 RepID=UPI0020073D6A|nr:uncharacterized protein BXZ73DRAFT_81248 [Epithele typhae]KAH9915774.1 hypothetical protein BXZ73DRAFT_81248 [Epithele typhae]
MTQMLPRLNWDILINIINVIDNPREIVRSFMSLNRYFYHEGAKVALQRPIRLDELDVLRLFLRFVKAEKWTRCRYIRHLYFAFGDPDEYDDKHVRLLAKFIARCTKLETLQLAGGGGDLFFDHTELWDACTTLSSLRNLHIYAYFGMGVYKLLQKLECTLSNVYLRIEDREDFDLDNDDSALDCSHPITLFANHRDTLESLICEHWYGLEHTPTAFYVYPKLLRLAIDYAIIRDVTSLVRAYPNLQYLRSSTAQCGYSVVSDEEKRQIRGENLDSQTGRGGVSWPCLQAFSGGIDELYILGLPGRIRRIEFQTVSIGCVLEGDALRNEMLEEVLAHAQPEHLRLECNDVLLGDARSGLVAALRGAGGENLRSLYVKTELATSLRSTRLAVLDLDVRFGKTGHHLLSIEGMASSADESCSDGERERRKRVRELRARSPAPPPLTDSEESTTRIDPDKYLRDLWETIPTLDEAVMRIQNPRRGRRNMGSRTATLLRGTARREDWPNEWATIPWVPHWRWGW